MPPPNTSKVPAGTLLEGKYRITKEIGRGGMAAVYEAEHVEIGKRSGLSAEEIERVTQGSSSPGWSAHDAAILRAVEELLADFAISDDTWETLAKSWDEPRLIELPMVIGQYLTTAFLLNSFRVQLGEGNPGLAHR